MRLPNARLHLYAMVAALLLLLPVSAVAEGGARAVEQGENLQGFVEIGQVSGGDQGFPSLSQQTYTVQPGDTLFSIAQQFGTTVEAIAEANGIDDPDFITVGQELIIPGEAGEQFQMPCTEPLVPLDHERHLAPDCVPNDLVEMWGSLTAGEQWLRAPAANAATWMLLAAYHSGHRMVVTSAYRSYETQEYLFNYWVNRLGREQAMRLSAQPGHSEHQLGTAIDLTGPGVDWQLSEDFAETGGFAWLQREAWRYGFVLSYPEGAEHVTGYQFEPWHWRWVGKDAAAEIAAGGWVPHEYLLERWTD
jgi:LAS superfamily LD-carboxypeptidase LdcB